MNKTLCAAILGLALVAGCDRDEGTKPASSAGGAPATTPSVPSAGVAATGPSSTGAAADDARQRAAAAESDVRAATSQAVGGAQAATTKAAATAQMTADEAKGMLNEAMNYVKEKKYDLAEKALNQVEANKASLPKSIQDQLANARTALDAAKAGNGLQIPGFGAGSK